MQSWTKLTTQSHQWCHSVRVVRPSDTVAPALVGAHAVLCYEQWCPSSLQGEVKHRSDGACVMFQWFCAKVSICHVYTEIQRATRTFNWTHTCDAHLPNPVALKKGKETGTEIHVFELKSACTILFKPLVDCNITQWELRKHLKAADYFCLAAHIYTASNQSSRRRTDLIISVNISVCDQRGSVCVVSVGHQSLHPWQPLRTCHAARRRVTQPSWALPVCGRTCWFFYLFWHQCATDYNSRSWGTFEAWILAVTDFGVSYIFSAFKLKYFLQAFFADRRDKSSIKDR